jgi:hypothetical protein
METVADPRPTGWWSRGSLRRQIENEHVDSPAVEQRTGDRQALVEIGRRDDDEPVQADSAGHGLDRIEAPGEIQPRDDRTAGLGLRHGSQGERRLAARAVTTQTDAGGSLQAPAAEDRIERLETGRDRAVRGGLPGRFGQLVGHGYGCEGTDDLSDLPSLSDLPRSCRTPARLKGRQSRCHIRRQGRHETRIIEHLF